MPHVFPSLPPCFSSLPWRERLHLYLRYASAPLEVLAAHVPPGKVADIGCGHGALTALLAAPGRSVTALDVDPRKRDFARQSVGRLPGVRVFDGSLEELARAEGGSFDAVVVADVLYLLGPSVWVDFLQSLRALLKPGGVLVLKDAEDDGSWRYYKCLAQEQLMVRLLRRTASSGGLSFAPRAKVAAALAEAGFEVRETKSLAGGYTTPHVLFVATCG